MNFNVSHPSGKVVYWINGVSFENSKDKRDGKQKAVNYCLDNLLNTNDIRKFDSRVERDRWEYLLDLQSKGLISNLDHHFIILIQKEFVNSNGDIIPAITYEADFIYKDLVNNKRVVEDVKGSEYFIDERFLTIKSVFDYLMLDKSLYIKVVLYRDKKWVEWHIGDKKKSGKLIKKQRAEIKALKEEKHKVEMAERKKNRELARLEELRKKPKLTTTEKARLKELEQRYMI